jgi:hypothetical protein
MKEILSLMKKFGGKKPVRRVFDQLGGAPRRERQRRLD